jgi:peptide/nickel transport system substrate-binding protein
VIVNMRKPPFSNVHARRALAFALDRARMVAIAGGSDLAAPTCQILPPGMPGYKPYCPFTAGSQTGRWSAPDLGRARRELELSGTHGAHVRLITSDETKDFGRQNLYLAASLRKLGYHATVKHYPTDNAYFAAAFNDWRHIDASVNGWIQDYPTPSNFFGALACINNQYTCSKALDRTLARTAETAAASGSSGVWTRLDREVTDKALMIPFITPKAVDFVSKRVGNYQHHPEFDLLIDQLWVR